MVTKHSMYRNMAVLCYEQQQIILIGGMAVSMGFLCRPSYVLEPHHHSNLCQLSQKTHQFKVQYSNVKHKKSHG